MNEVYKERFPQATFQMEFKLEKLLDELLFSHSAHDRDEPLESTNEKIQNSLSTQATIEDSEILSLSNKVPKIIDAAGRFIATQLGELARDCLIRSREKRLSSTYFYSFTQNLETLLLNVSKERIIFIFINKFTDLNFN